MTEGFCTRCGGALTIVEKFCAKCGEIAIAVNSADLYTAETELFVEEEEGHIVPPHAAPTEVIPLISIPQKESSDT